MLENRLYLLGDNCSAPDIFLTMLMHWSRRLSPPATKYANLRGLSERVSARPAYQRMLQQEGIA